ncbi:hypothetical protein JTB14_016140 [Gonioctena quinquepunctata]|nr:hypothetical protein JTB14_016140 [Gonioctena quinquepunctata]
MVLVQEPYAYKDPAGKWRIPGFSTYKIAACSRERPLAAIIILNQKADALRLRTDCEQHFTAMKFQTARRKELLVGSIYCNPTSEIIPLLEAIGNLASKHVLAPMIFGGDFNAKSNLWHSRLENDRGLEVERFLAEEDMFVLNRPNEPDTFSTVNGTANIDLTIVNSRAHRAPHTWKIGWDPSAVEPDLSPTKYNVRRVNLEKLNQLGPGVELRLRNQILTNESELKQAIQKLTNEMVQVTGSRPQSLNQCAISRNLSQEIKDQRKQAYQSILRDYKISIRRAKSESWCEFVEADLGTNPWGFTYRLASAKVRTSHLTSAIEDSAGQETTDMVETLQEIACQLMPDDDPATDNEENRRIRNGVREFTGSNIPVSPITEEDITEAAMRVKPGRAPGPDEARFYGTSLWALLRARWPNKVAITAYADDIALAINADSRRELEELVSQALEIVSHWAESHKLDIAVNKTKYIVFSKLSINRNPIVRYRDVPIDRVRHLKYLGVILDERMSFTEHIGYISNKARSIFQSLRKFALPRWGNCVDSLKKIYQVAIIPIVGYASEVWLDKAESRQNKQKLRSMQCFCLRVILGAYKTVPNETACVLAKQLPIDLELKGRLAFSELRKIGRTIILGHEVILREYRFWVAAALQVRAWLVGAWQALWNSTSKGRHCHELIRNLSSWTDIGHNQLSRVIISFLSSHGNCGAHLFRIGKRNSPECDICGEEDTPAHRLSYP